MFFIELKCFKKRRVFFFFDFFEGDIIEAQVEFCNMGGVGEVEKEGGFRFFFPKIIRDNFEVIIIVDFCADFLERMKENFCGTIAIFQPEGEYGNFCVKFRYKIFGRPPQHLGVHNRINEGITN